MDVVCKSPYKSEISFQNGKVHIIGPLSLVKKINELKEKFGADPQKWPALVELKNTEDLLINEFILKTQSSFKLAFDHEELCHCRMVPAEKVYNAIKQGCKTIDEIARTTLAGTGCGSCRPDSEKLLQQFKLN